MRFISLSEDEQVLINKLERESSNHITRLRCHLLKLSNKKLSMKEVSRLTDIKWLRICEFFNAWERAENLDEKIKTLSIKKGRGAKVKLDSVKNILPELLRENSRNLNSVISVLAKKHGIKVCKLTLQNYLKKNSTLDGEGAGNL